MPPQYGQQGVSGYCQQGQPAYYNQQPPPHLAPQAQYLQSQPPQRYQAQQVSAADPASFSCAHDQKMVSSVALLPAMEAVGDWRVGETVPCRCF